MKRLPVEFWVGVTLIILSAFSVIAKRTILASACLSVCPSVCLSVPMEQLGTQWTDFREGVCSWVLPKAVDKIQFWLKSEKSNGHFAGRPKWVSDNILLWLLLHWKEHSGVAMNIRFISFTGATCLTCYVTRTFPVLFNTGLFTFTEFEHVQNMSPRYCRKRTS
jgi:hypothetical protein